MNQPKLVNSIAIKTEKYGVQEVLPALAKNNLGLIYEPESDASLLIEITDSEAETDYLLEVEFASHITDQRRPSLYSGECSGSTKELKKLRDQLEVSKGDNDKLFERNSELTAEVAEAKRLKEEAETQLQAMRESKFVHSVEAWCYDKQGFVQEHYILTSEDVDEEIPIGTAVIQLRRQAAEEGTA